MAVAAAVGRDDRRGDGGEEDGGAHPAAVRADAGAQVGDRDGELRHQRGAVLPVILGGDGRGPHRAR